MPDTDFDLVNGIYEQIGKKYGKGAHVTEFTDEERIVILVMLTTGIVANGGFQYLFEGEYNGDESFSLTLEAFRAIGCDKAAQVLKSALSLFPYSKPPQSIDKRLQIYNEYDKSVRDDLGSRFWAEHDQIVAFMAGYIRANLQHSPSLHSPTIRRFTPLSCTEL